MGTNIAIRYHPDGFDTNVSRLMGRQAAGEGMLRAWVQHANVTPFICHADSAAMARHFAGMVKSFGGDAPTAWIGLETPHLLSGVGTLLLPGPGVGISAWQRRHTGQRGYSIIGLTHTTASANAMDSIVDLLSAPVQPWDALICTSSAVKTTVQDLWSSHAEYLAQRFGHASDRVLTTPQLPIIPLGVDTDAYAPNAASRNAWRQRLGIDQDDRVVLFVGRLSFHAKAHPVPMYQALEAAVKEGRFPSTARVHLIESGWFANDFIRDAFAEMAALHCPSVVRHVVDGRQSDVRTSIWHAADIFCSLSDNIQETFGLTPIEAMAAGLPCVVSDWDGYKETVRDGIDGFRVSTWMPNAPLGEDLAQRHANGIDNYDSYCGQACQFVAVDVAAVSEAFRRLLTEDDLRRRMGAAARERAKTVFDWRHIIAQYQSLATELFAIRANESIPESAPLRQGQPSWPARSDPFRSFGHYPTHNLTLDTLVVASDPRGTVHLAALREGPMVRYAERALPDIQDCHAFLEMLASHGRPVSAGTLINQLPPERRGIAFRGLVWLAKFNQVRLIAPSAGKTS
ncbi:glycosyltransferase family 4 protein [Niveispirillum cyanobacteriorum]|nr:glycosyltransferase family 4 protein [Niveispirillum cyanobacteriorum]GGE45568.1 hypothetical protein GCM10011317_00080 [Niveispirillum cyanobacteriorum]